MRVLIGTNIYNGINWVREWRNLERLIDLLIISKIWKKVKYDT